MLEKSLIEFAYDVLSASKSPVPFKELFDRVIEESELKLTGSQIKDKIGKFYTQLSIDGRFLMLDNNTWDLRSRYNNVRNTDYDEDDDEMEEDFEERALLRKELGEDEEDEADNESDDLDFDKPQNADEDEGEF